MKIRTAHYESECCGACQHWQTYHGSDRIGVCNLAEEVTLKDNTCEEFVDVDDGLLRRAE